MGEGDVEGGKAEKIENAKEEIKTEIESDVENGAAEPTDEEKMDQLEILRRCRSVKQGLEALRQEQSSILHSLVATLTAIRREKDPDTRYAQEPLFSLKLGLTFCSPKINELEFCVQIKL